MALAVFGYLAALLSDKILNPLPLDYALDRHRLHRRAFGASGLLHVQRGRGDGLSFFRQRGYVGSVARSMS